MLRSLGLQWYITLINLVNQKMLNNFFKDLDKQNVLIVQLLTKNSFIQLFMFIIEIKLCNLQKLKNLNYVIEFVVLKIRCKQKNANEIMLIFFFRLLYLIIIIKSLYHNFYFTKNFNIIHYSNYFIFNLHQVILYFSYVNLLFMLRCNLINKIFYI